MAAVRIALAQWDRLGRDIESCCRCPRLREYCIEIGKTRKRAYADWDYHARPVRGFGDSGARLWIIGLAPAAHGANRTGRVFTGDRSGDFLFAALHRAGYASQPQSFRRDDGLRLTDCYISAAVRCAPPDNKPLPAEIAKCAPFIHREWDLLSAKRTILALGRIGWDAALRLARDKGCAFAAVPFAHGARIRLDDGGLCLVGSYHVSQQNTFTGKLTEAMFDEVLQLCNQE